MHDLLEDRPKSHVIKSPEPLRPAISEDREKKSKTYAFGESLTSNYTSESSTPLSPSKVEFQRSRERSSNISSSSSLPDQEKNQPTLLKITKKESLKMSDLEKPRVKVFPKGGGRIDENVENGHGKQSTLPMSYTVQIVGGVPIRKVTPDASPAQVRKRTGGAKHSRSKRSSRHISCVQLGPGQCEGYLWRKKERKQLRTKWDRVWCKLVENTVYIYPKPEALVAVCTFCVNSFKFTPYETKEKKYRFGFRVHNVTLETAMCFAAETQSDCSKWMNMLVLTAENIKTDGAIGGFTKPEIPDHISESEEENDSSVEELPTLKQLSISTLNKEDIITNSDGSHPLTKEEENKLKSTVRRRHMHRKDTKPPAKNLEDLFKSLHEDKISMLGTNKMDQRKSHLVKPKKVRNSKDVENCRKLQGLQRTLKAKEQEIEEINELLTKYAKDKLTRFQAHHRDSLHNMQKLQSNDVNENLSSVKKVESDSPSLELETSSENGEINKLTKRLMETGINYDEINSADPEQTDL